MPRLFISHSSKDSFEAIAFHAWLLQEGWGEDDVFIDLHDITAGSRWKDALARANERCEAVILLASPASLGSTECRLEIRMAEDYGKEIIVAILHLLTPESEELGVYRERQIVDLSLEPRDATFVVEFNGQSRSIAFSRRTLRSIKARLEQLGISPTSFTWRPADPQTACPYPGLEGYTQKEAALFFGRSGDVARGLAEIRKLRHLGVSKIMMIQAASGAGKSSFLKAGIWPHIERNSDYLPLGILRPATGIISGDSGLGRQLSALFLSLKQSTSAAEIHSRLKGDPVSAATALADLINEAIRLAHAAEVVVRPDAAMPFPVIAVDQAEELFATADHEESNRFLGILTHLLNPDFKLLMSPVLLVWTIRADSVDTMLQGTQAAGLKPPEPFLLPPIGRDAYREIVTAPISVANQAGMRVSIEPELVDALIGDATGADALPLLSFTLRQLFEDQRVGTTAALRLEQFAEAGGVGRILAKRLEAAQRAASSSPEALRRLIVPALATWDEAANGGKGAAKRLVALTAEAVGGARSELSLLADRLVEARLLSRGPDTLEIAHEALLRQPPINQWLMEDKEFLSWLDRIRRAKALNEINIGQLVFGAPKQDVERWLKDRREEIPDQDVPFIVKALEEAENRTTRLQQELAATQEQLQYYRDKYSVDWAIGVVPGTGTAQPMELISEVCSAMRNAKPELGLELGTETQTFEGQEKAGTETQTYYNLVRHGQLQGSDSLRIGTTPLRTADSRRSYFSLPWALLTDAAGVRFFTQIVDKSRQSYIVRALAMANTGLLKAIILILTLFVLPVTLVSFALSFLSLLGLSVFKTQLAGFQKEFIALASIMVCIALAVLGIKRNWQNFPEQRLKVASFVAVAAIASIIGIVMLLGDSLWISFNGGHWPSFYWQGSGRQSPGSQYSQLPLALRDLLVEYARILGNVELADRIRVVDETGVYIALMHVIQLVLSSALLFMMTAAGVSLAYLALTSGVTSRSSRTAVFATVSVFTVWIVNIILLWPENIAASAAMGEFRDDTRLNDTVTITGINWSAMTIETLRVGLADALHYRPGFMHNRLYSDVYAITWADALIIMFLFLFVIFASSFPLARRIWLLWRRGTALALFAPSPDGGRPLYRDTPRIIAVRFYVFFILSVIVVLSGITFSLVVSPLHFENSYIRSIASAIPQEIAVGSEWVRVGTLVVWGLMLQWLFKSGHGLRFLLDVVDHFTAPNHGFPIRRRIAARYKLMVDQLLGMDDKPNLLIIAHGQGTMTVLDALMDEDWSRQTLQRVSTLTIVTMGCPLTQFYQNYFPDAYGRLATTHLNSLSKDGRVNWFNVYRIDDGIGTWVDPSIPNFPVNVPAPAGGHTHYWSGDVFQELFKQPGMKNVLVVQKPENQTVEPALST